MNALKHVTVLALAALAFVGSARSSVITINEVIDLDDWAINGYQLIGTTGYTISEGDTVDIHYSFANGKAIQLTNGNATATTINPAWPWLFTNLEDNPPDTSFTILDATTTLTNPGFVGGSGDTTVFLPVQSSSGPLLGPDNALSLDALTTLTFTGISSTFTVDHLAAGSRSYFSWFVDWGFTGAELAVVDTNPRVPDQGATLSLLGLGLTALALARRKN